MPRTKNPQKKRKQKTIKSYRTNIPANRNKRIQNVGGHIVNPPKECPYRKIDRPFGFSKRASGYWVDIGCCISCCDRACDFWRWYKNASPQERRTYKLKNGVINATIMS